MLVTEGISRLADGVGVILLAWLMWRLFFEFTENLQGGALTVAVLGLVAAATDRRAAKRLPLALLIYVGIASISAAAARWTVVSSSPEPEWLSLFTPAVHLMVMALFVGGAAYLLRTPARLSWFAVTMLLAVGVLAIQIAFDRASAGFVYVRGGSSLASVPHWGGIHGTSLALTLGLPLATVGMVSRSSTAQTMASILLGAALFVVAYFNGSRGGLVAMAVVAATMGVFFVVRADRRAQSVVLGTAAIGVALGIAITVWALRGYLDHGEDLSGRTLMWEGARRLIADHLWLGIGPGNYGSALLASGYVDDFPSHYVGLRNAHNLFLHTAAETGVIGAGFLVVFLLGAIRGCWNAWRSGHMPVVSLAVLFALEGFLVHSMSENFLDARAYVERTRLVVWFFLAAALALERLAQSTARSTESSPDEPLSRLA